MGVTGLWGILEPVKKHRRLESLQGETVAVDLSVWICEASVKQMQGAVVKPHLRTLFFRVSNLLSLGINLVFVLEGKAPELKFQTIANRQRARYGGNKTGKSTAPKRSHFMALIRECCEMLDYLGVPYIQAVGEAEAMCAYLNKQGFVDACITEDGDAFLYGAKTVYRNFTLDRKDPHIESYHIDNIVDDLNLSQEKLVALSLFLGCDFIPKGVPGVGPKQASELIRNMPGEVLPVLRLWKLKTSQIPSCVSNCRNLQKLFESVRRKAWQVEGFPNEEVISEFLVSKDKCARLDSTWNRPNMLKLCVFSIQKMDWVGEYSVEKCLPLVSLWDMFNMNKPGEHLKPIQIIKTRIRSGVACYEVEWEKLEADVYTEKPVYTTIEKQSLFSEAFPLIHETFMNSVAAKISKKMKKNRYVLEEDDSSQCQSSQHSASIINRDEMAQTISSKPLRSIENTEKLQRMSKPPSNEIPSVKSLSVIDALDLCLNSDSESGSQSPLPGTPCRNDTGSLDDSIVLSYIPLHERIKVLQREAGLKMNSPIHFVSDNLKSGRADNRGLFTRLDSVERKTKCKSSWQKSESGLKAMEDEAAGVVSDDDNYLDVSESNLIDLSLQIENMKLSTDSPIISKRPDSQNCDAIHKTLEYDEDSFSEFISHDGGDTESQTSFIPIEQDPIKNMTSSLHKSLELWERYDAIDSTETRTTGCVKRRSNDENFIDLVTPDTTVSENRDGDANDSVLKNTSEFLKTSDDRRQSAEHVLINRVNECSLYTDIENGPFTSSAESSPLVRITDMRSPGQQRAILDRLFASPSFDDDNSFASPASDEHRARKNINDTTCKLDESLELLLSQVQVTPYVRTGHEKKAKKRKGNKKSNHQNKITGNESTCTSSLLNDLLKTNYENSANERTLDSKSEVCDDKTLKLNSRLFSVLHDETLFDDSIVTGTNYSFCVPDTDDEDDEEVETGNSFTSS